MEKQEIRTFGRRHGKKLSARQTRLIDTVLPAISPKNIKKAGTVILEIGFGAGEHVRALACAHPDATVIGAEPFMNGVASLLSAITDDGTDEILPEYRNIYIWPDDVRDMLRATDIKYDAIWILHPDPWPKAKHEKRRLLGAEFLTLLATRLTPNGQIIIGTDHWEYFDWIVEQIAQTPLRRIPADMEIIHTRYQQKNKAQTCAPKYLVLAN